MSPLATSIFAFDKATARTIDAQGFLHVSMSNISKETVNPYMGREIPGWQENGLDPAKVYHVYRPGEELRKAASTFDNLPLLFGHKAVSAEEFSNDPKLKTYIVGSTGTDASFGNPYLKNSLVVWTQDAVKSIDAMDHNEISCAYTYTFVKKPGTFKGMPYDGYMTKIQGNHVALVTEGRAGPDVVVADAAITARPDVSPKEGTEKYGDVKFADAKNHKYPIDTAEHVRAALAYWGVPANKAKYQTEEQATITAHINAAAKKFGVGTTQDHKEPRMDESKIISPQGQMVRGALHAYLCAHLIEDAQIKPGEVGIIVKDIQPGDYSVQVVQVSSDILAAFDGRITPDASQDEIAAILDSLSNEFATDAKLFPCKKCDKTLSAKPGGLCPKCAPDTTENMAGDDGSTVGEPVTAPTDDAKCPKCGKDKKGAICKDCDSTVGGTIDNVNPAHTSVTGDTIMPESIKDAITQDALDAALKANTAATIADVGARFQAGKDVEPYIGSIDVMAADSASAIYKLALDAKKVNVEGVDPSAYKAMLALVPSKVVEAPAPVLAADAASISDFRTRFPHATAVKKG